MAISEGQMQTWSTQGSVSQSAATYQTVRNVLDSTQSPYYSKSFNIFLQGSYGNDTNIYADSDVDVVICLTSTYYHDKDSLSPSDQAELNRAFVPATYELSDFKQDVATWLTQKFGNGVSVGNKAIFIPGNGARRDADVIVAAEHRTYYSQTGYQEGIVFETSYGQRIINYPKQHSDNLTSKHQATGNRFKPTVRAFKNMRNKMIADGYLNQGISPSYYLEGLLFNAPNNCFAQSYQETYARSVTYLRAAVRDQLVCANDIHYLVRDYSSVNWTAANFDAYMKALDAYW
jgi:hypothetical protein